MLNVSPGSLSPKLKLEDRSLELVSQRPPTDAPPTDAPPTDAPPTDAPPTVAPTHRRTDAPSHRRTVAPTHRRTIVPTHRLTGNAAPEVNVLEKMPSTRSCARLCLIIGGWLADWRH